MSADRLAGVIWITGLSASGKTTMGQHLWKELESHRITNVDLLDGEELRRRADRAYGFSTEERNAFAFYIARVAKASLEKGNIVIVCAISHVRNVRSEIRREIGQFMEVFLECPVQVCAQRDYKGHYKRALAGEIENFVGVTEPYQESERPDLVLHTARDPIDVCLNTLTDRALAFLRNGAGPER